MGTDVTLGLFALYIVFVSLSRFFQEQEFCRLTAMKKVWGRKPGLVLHFLSSVALPLVFGMVFLCEGIAGGGFVKLLSSEPSSVLRQGAIVSILEEARTEWEKFNFEISDLSPLHVFPPGVLTPVSVVLLSP